MSLSNPKFKKAVLKELPTTINKAMANLPDNIEKDVLETKIDKLSGELTESYGHTRLDTTDVLADMVANSIITKLQKPSDQPVEEILKEELNTIVQGALSELRRL
jgi:uncharacterized protein (DUF111 family)